MAESNSNSRPRAVRSSGGNSSVSSNTKSPTRASTKSSVGREASVPSGRQSRKTSTSKMSAIKLSNNAYKKGKLSKNARFSPRKIKWTPIIILGCLVLSFILAMIVGNALAKKVENSQNTTPPTSDSSNLIPPSADKVSPYKELNAYFADMTGADPANSLSVLTANARSKGNALFINIKNDQNKIIYTSDKVTELGFEHQENLMLSRLKNHFDYYDDFAVGFFTSDFSAKADIEDGLKLQTNEILLLKEAADFAFDQILIEFSDNFTKSNIINYQTYLLNLKIACPNVAIGISLSHAFLSDSDNAGDVAKLLEIADFFALDLGSKGADEIKSVLSPLVYFTERYDCVIMLSDTEDTALEEKIAALKDKGIENYVIY